MAAHDAQEEKRVVTLVVLGEAKVGKTTLLTRIINNAFLSEYQPTPSPQDVRKTTQQLQFNFRDTPGTAQTELDIKSYCEDRVDGFLLVFNTMDPASFEKAKNMYEHVKNFNLPMLLIGTKGSRDSTVTREAILEFTFSRNLPNLALDMENDCGSLISLQLQQIFALSVRQRLKSFFQMIDDASDKKSKSIKFFLDNLEDPTLSDAALLKKGMRLASSQKKTVEFMHKLPEVTAIMPNKPQGKSQSAISVFFTRRAARKAAEKEIAAQKKLVRYPSIGSFNLKG